MNDLLQRLRERKLVQWALAYVAAAFALLQGLDIIAQQFGWADGVRRGITIALIAGFFVALVLAWYHGERGAQRVTGTELLIIALLLALGGGALWRIAPTAATPEPRVAAGNPAPPAAEPAVSVQVDRKSIAVLPFENLSEDKANGYFATGMQDEILTRLAAIRDLKVISRTSTEQYASHPPNLRIVAEQLGVATVLEGSVQRAGGKVRINLQLINAHDDSHLWAKNYDRDIADVFAVQSDVAEKVADALKAQLLPAESARIASVPTTSIQAHDLFLKAQDLFNQLQTSTANDPAAAGAQAVDFYRGAIAADPKFALAYAQLSYLLGYLHWYGIDNRASVVADSLDAAEHALKLQPDLPEAHLAMGYVHYWGHRDYAPALAEFSIARAGMPNSAEALAGIAYVHRRQGLFTQCIAELQQASLLDPRNLLVPREIATSYVALRRYAEAEPIYAHTLDVSPGDVEAQVQHSTSRILSGDTESAERLLDAIPRGSDPQGTVSLLRFKLHMLLRQPDAALASIAHSPDWLLARFEHSATPIGLLRGQALAMKGETAAARDAFLQARQALQARLKNPVTAADAHRFLGLVEAGLGDKQAALKSGRAAAEQLPMSRDAIVGSYTLERLARVESQVGETASAIDHLRQLLESPSGEVVSVATLRIDPVWDPLRKDPRFQALLKEFATATPVADASVSTGQE
ncbi:MAG: winged helix-turn-helix domain-containing protein [Rudaea sp.]